MARTEGIPAIEQYITNLYAKEDAILAQCRHTLSSTKAAIQVSPMEGKIIQVLLQMIEAKNVLEIGTLAGYSSIWIARALPLNGRLHTIEKSQEHHAIAQRNIELAGLMQRVTLHNAEALKILDQMNQYAPFDAVFIDADKANYPNYLNHAYSLLRIGGIVIADNTRLFDLLLTKPTAENRDLHTNMQLFNEMLADTSRFTSIMLPTTEGLSIGIKK
jgi:predicted O-methyltransferase YrrM